MLKINQKILADLAKFIEMRYGINVAAYQETHPELFKSFLRLQYWLDEVVLDRYFGDNDNAEEEGTYWKNQLVWETRKTGQQLLEKLQELDPQLILDVGCGDNEWKQYFGSKLTGIDPYNSNADQRYDIMNYDHNMGKWDVVLCLGSINFGDQKTIENQVYRAVKLCKPGGKIFWRCNPGITHDNEHAQWVDFYPWSEEELHRMAKQFKCTVEEIDWDQPEDNEQVRWGNRLYSEWTKDAWNT